MNQHEPEIRHSASWRVVRLMADGRVYDTVKISLRTRQDVPQVTKAEIGVAIYRGLEVPDPEVFITRRAKSGESRPFR